MDILYNNSLINQIVEKLFKHKKKDYPEDPLQRLLYFGEIEHQLHHVVNQSQQKLYTSIFKKSRNPNVCIVYMHGYGSNRLECLNIVNAIPADYALCCFDFSGSGKSEGQTSTYGIKQKQDINSIIKYLKHLQFKKFILWGRSMGATAILLYSIHYQPQDVLVHIIDSPFYAFQTIALQIANKNVSAPQFLLSFAIQMAKKNCQKMEYNPFSIQLSNVDQCNIPTLFVYHQNDDVISCKNTYPICSKYKAAYEKLAIEQNHNIARSLSTIEKILTFIQRYYNRYESQRIMAIFQLGVLPSPKKECSTPRSCQSKANSSTESNKSKPRKGIERVNLQMTNKKYQNFGMFFAYTQRTENPQSAKTERKYASCKRAHPNLINHPSSKKQMEVSLMQVSKQTSQVCEFNIKGISPIKKKRKIGTVKSLVGSRLQKQ